MAVKDIPFEDIVIPLYAEGSQEQILAHSPAGKVPILIDGDSRCWGDGSAILEYLAVKDRPVAGRRGGPGGHARAIAAEMHPGSVPLRRHCPMNMHRPAKRLDLPADVAADVGRIEMRCGAIAAYGSGRAGHFWACRPPTPCAQDSASTPMTSPSERARGAHGSRHGPVLGTAGDLGAAAQRDRLSTRVARTTEASSQARK